MAFTVSEIIFKNGSQTPLDIKSDFVLYSLQAKEEKEGEAMMTRRGRKEEVRRGREEAEEIEIITILMTHLIWFTTLLCDPIEPMEPLFGTLYGTQDAIGFWVEAGPGTRF